MQPQDDIEVEVLQTIVKVVYYNYYKLECFIGISTTEKKTISPHVKNYNSCFFVCVWDSQSAADMSFAH